MDQNGWFRMDNSMKMVDIQKLMDGLFHGKSDLFFNG